jgi:hypothetical protein
VAISPRPLDGAPDVEQDLQTVLEWLRAQYAGGRAKIYAPLVLCREIFGTGGQCDPYSWARLWRVLPLLLERGLIEEVALPQGDPGVRLSPRGA